MQTGLAFPHLMRGYARPFFLFFPGLYSPHAASGSCSRRESVLSFRMEWHMVRLY